MVVAVCGFPGLLGWRVHGRCGNAAKPVVRGDQGLFPLLVSQPDRFADGRGFGHAAQADELVQVLHRHRGHMEAALACCHDQAFCRQACQCLTQRTETDAKAGFQRAQVQTLTGRNVTVQYGCAQTDCQRMGQGAAFVVCLQWGQAFHGNPQNKNGRILPIPILMDTIGISRNVDEMPKYR